MSVFLIVIYVARDLLLVVLTVSAPLALATRVQVRLVGRSDVAAALRKDLLA